MLITSARRLRRGLLASVVAAGALVGVGSSAVAAPVGVDSTTTLVSSKASFVRGESAKFTVTVAKVAGQPKPTGDVTLLVDGEPLEVKALVSAKATFTTRLLTVGSHQVAADYAGDGAYAPSSSSPVEVTVAKGATATTISSRTEPVPSGKAAVLSTLSKRINPAAGGTLTSTVAYTATPATGSPVTTTVAAGSTGSSQWRPKLADGTWTITATYAGNDDFAGSEAAPLTITVGRSAPAGSSIDISTLDASFTYNYNLLSIDDDVFFVIGESFTPTRSGLLDKVSFRAVSSCEAPMAVTIRTLDGADHPSSTVLGRGTLTAAAGAGDDGVDEVVLDAPVAVEAGTSYGLQLEVPTPVSGQCYWTPATTDNGVYPGHEAFQLIFGTWNPTGADLSFAIWIR